MRSPIFFSAFGQTPSHPWFGIHVPSPPWVTREFKTPIIEQKRKFPINTRECHGFPVRAQPTGVCGCGDGLGLSDPSPTRAREAGSRAGSQDHVIYHQQCCDFGCCSPHHILAHAAHENNAPSTITRSPPLFLRDVGSVATRRHPIATSSPRLNFGRPHQLAPPLAEGCGLAPHRPNPPPPPRPGWHQMRTTRGLHERRSREGREDVGK